MKLLLDTHALLWWLADDARLGAQARDAVADPANDVHVSAASLWEIVVKRRVGKLDADIAEVAKAVGKCGFMTLDIRLAHLTVLADLPTHHRDPFDHLLIAQAIAEDLILVSEDRNIPRYPVRWRACSTWPASVEAAPRP